EAVWRQVHEQARRAAGRRSEPGAAARRGRGTGRAREERRDRPRGRPADGAARPAGAAGGGRAAGDRAARRARQRAGGPLDRLILLCSRNPNKLRELSALGRGLGLLGADRYPEEGKVSYVENARAKALYGREVGPAEAWMLGEDSGLEVVALGGGPGVRSARYGSEDGGAVERLLRELQGVEDRRARYVCELV